MLNNYDLHIMPKSDSSNRERKREKNKKHFDESGVYTSKHVRQKEAMFANSSNKSGVVIKPGKNDKG